MATYPASDYPGALDTDIPDVVAEQVIASSWGNAVRNAILATQGELGTNPSGAASTVGARFTAVEGDVADLATDVATAQGDITALASDVAALPGGESNVFDAVAYGALVDGTTNDTAAWQAAINACAAAGGGTVMSSLPGVSVIAGALQDTGGANAQLLLPDVHMLDAQQMGMVIRGPWEQSAVCSVVGAAVTPTTGLVLKSTLASGTGAVIGGYGSGTSYQHFTFLNVRLENLTVRTVANPTITGIDLRHVDTCTLENVLIDTGQYSTSLTQPTTSTSFGLRLPGINNGANVNLHKVSVFGFYNGIEHSEHASFDNVSVGATKVAITAVAANHASHYRRVLVSYYATGLKFTGTHYLDVEQWAVEHASSGWMATTYDVDDASNYGKGLIRWAAVAQGVGPHNSFVVNGGSGITTSRVGASFGSGGSLSVQDENGTAITGVTQLDFQGAGVTATSGSGEVVVTIPGGAGYVYRDRLVATGGEAVITLGATPVANSPVVWVNNVIKWPATDYTGSGAVLALGTALSASDVVLVQYHSAASSASTSTLTAPAVNIVDAFTRANSTTSLGSTTTGSKAWTANTGVWGIVSNTGYVDAGSASIVNRATVDAAVSACTLSVSISLASGGTIAPSGFVVRSDGSNNYYLVEVTMNTSAAPKIYKGVSGSNSVLATGSAINIPAGATITCEVVGSTITVKYLGSTIVSVTDSSYNANTRFGLYTQAPSGGLGAMRFDDFSIQP